MWSFGLAAVLGAFATSVAALDAVEVYGNKFFNKDGSQFFMKGMSQATRAVDLGSLTTPRGYPR
jgi:hypothetical protein